MEDRGLEQNPATASQLIVYGDQPILPPGSDAAIDATLTELDFIVKAWKSLSCDVRAEVIALVQAGLDRCDSRGDLAGTALGLADE